MAEGKNRRRKRRTTPGGNDNGGNGNGNGSRYMIINTFGTVVSATSIAEALKAIGR